LCVTVFSNDIHPIIDLNGQSEELHIKNHLSKFWFDPMVNEARITILLRQLRLEKQNGVQCPTHTIRTPNAYSIPLRLFYSSQRFCDSVSTLGGAQWSETMPNEIVISYVLKQTRLVLLTTLTQA